MQKVNLHENIKLKDLGWIALSFDRHQFWPRSYLTTLLLFMLTYGNFVRHNAFNTKLAKWIMFTFIEIYIKFCETDSCIIYWLKKFYVKQNFTLQVE